MITIIMLQAMLQASVPPHRRVLEMLKRGEIQTPYYMKHAKELRARGYNAPWRAEPVPGSGLSRSPGRSLGAAVSPADAATFYALIVLVSFKESEGDLPYVWRADPTIFDSLMFGRQPGSLWDYYDKASYGRFNLTTEDLPSAIGVVQADCTMAWYTNGENGMGDTERSVSALVAEVAAKIDDGRLDFSIYDNNDDGEVDAFFLVHAGPGAEYTGSDDHIWSHASSTSKRYNTHDGVYVSRYSTEPEYWDSVDVVTKKTDMTIGVFAHEMGHSFFGLPDLYDTDLTSEGLGSWSLMSAGSWNGNPAGPGGESPALPDAWSAIEMRFATAINVTANVMAQEINNAADSDEIYRLWNGGDGGQEYFLVQNRQQKGYDTYLPGSGLAIFHIDEAVHGNDSEWFPTLQPDLHYKVALEQADGLWDLEHKVQRGDDGDLYPGFTVNRAFGSFTVPDSRKYDDEFSYVRISNISDPADIMTADLAVFPDPVVVTAPGAIAVTVDEAGTDIQILIIDNTEGSTDLAYEIELSDSARTDSLFNTQSYDWLTISSDSGTVAAGSSVEIDVTINAGALPSDIYQAFIHILNNDPDVLDQVVDVQMAVTPMGVANITALTDFPDDGGRMLDIAWEASIDDNASSTNPVAYYRVWLRDAGDNPLLIEQPVMVNGTAGWGTYIDSIAATEAASYTAMVPTHQDSNAVDQNWSYLKVSAHTAHNSVVPSFSTVTRGYSIDSQGPGSPTNLSIASMIDSIVVAWQFDLAANHDFSHFNVYRDTLSTFEPDVTLPYGIAGSSNSFVDLHGVNKRIYYYQVAAVDINGNIGELSSPTDGGYLETEPGPALPAQYALGQNYPNPFNPTTTISLEIPKTGRVELIVYDLLGREVVKLVDGVIEPGKFIIRWSGRDARGAAVPSGIYFARMHAARYSKTIKMLLLK
ncbi:M6 family metalloprotease domain-containing protein [Candidatus Neomarinimicrobiota bacterium]